MNFKKISWILITSFVLAFTLPAPKIYAEKLTVLSQTITPRAEAIDWRYKVEDGKLYKRLYNYSLSCWVGEWILCP